MWHRGPPGAPLPKILFRCLALGGSGPSGAFPPNPPFAPLPLVGVASEASAEAMGGRT